VYNEAMITKTTEQKMIEVAKSFGVDTVIPNDKQLLQWTVNRIVSGDKTVLRKLNQL
jgi:hypothetical protein